MQFFFFEHKSTFVTLIFKRRGVFLLVLRMETCSIGVILWKGKVEWLSTGSGWDERLDLLERYNEPTVSLRVYRNGGIFFLVFFLKYIGSARYRGISLPLPSREHHAWSSYLSTNLRCNTQVRLGALGDKEPQEIPMHIALSRCRDSLFLIDSE